MYDESFERPPEVTEATFEFNGAMQGVRKITRIQLCDFSRGGAEVTSIEGGPETKNLKVKFEKRGGRIRFLIEIFGFKW